MHISPLVHDLCATMKPHHNLAQWGNPGKAGKLSLGPAAPPPIARNNTQRVKPTPDFLLDRVATYVFVTNIIAGTVTAIDSHNQEVVATFVVGRGPNGITYRP